jgi:hypothetical protein
MLENEYTFPVRSLCGCARRYLAGADPAQNADRRPAPRTFSPVVALIVIDLRHGFGFGLPCGTLVDVGRRARWRTRCCNGRRCGGLAEVIQDPILARSGRRQSQDWSASGHLLPLAGYTWSCVSASVRGDRGRPAGAEGARSGGRPSSTGRSVRTRHGAVKEKPE